MAINEAIKIHEESLAAFCREYNIISLSVFGSALNESFNDDSDIDLLVRFEEGKKPSLFELVEMEKKLSELFFGRKVDMRTYEDLSRYFRDEVVSNAEVVLSLDA